MPLFVSIEVVTGYWYRLVYANDNIELLFYAIGDSQCAQNGSPLQQ